jgi:MoaA/NifB/PqqE/SkfB family radical SAM enzyme
MRRVRPEWVPRPHAAHLILTYKCNLKCEACPSWEVTEHNDLSTEEWLGVFEQLKSLDVVKVLGGEPLIRKDIVELLTGIRDIIDPYMLQLTTNGMMTQRTLDVLRAVAWPGLQLRISVDGLERTHDWMRGVKGSWKKVTKTVREVAALREEYGFKFGINFALTDRSIQELDEMIAFSEEMGADLIPGICVDPFLIGATPPEQGGEQKVILITDKEAVLKALNDQRVGTRRELPGLDHLLSKRLAANTFEQQLTGETSAFPCRELRDLLYLLPNGNVVRCGMDHEPIGNLREQSFDSIWFGERMCDFRDKVDKCPGCKQASVQILSRLYSGTV